MTTTLPVTIPICIVEDGVDPFLVAARMASILRSSFSDLASLRVSAAALSRTSKSSSCQRSCVMMPRRLMRLPGGKSWQSHDMGWASVGERAAEAHKWLTQQVQPVMSQAEVADVEVLTTPDELFHSRLKQWKSPVGEKVRTPNMKRSSETHQHATTSGMCADALARVEACALIGGITTSLPTTPFSDHAEMVQAQLRHCR